VTAPTLEPEQAVAHLEPAVWSAVNLELVAKAISELAHELLLSPRQTGVDGPWRQYVLAGDEPTIEHHFRAQILRLDHWLVDPRSLRKVVGSAPAAVDGMAFFVEHRRALGLSDEILPGYLEDLAGTLTAAAAKRARSSASAADLGLADFQSIEAGMTEGHPIFVANCGRIGFDAADYRAFAPECAEAVLLLWLAAKRELVDFAAVDGITPTTLARAQLSASELARFASVVEERGATLDECVLIPVHPWQWQNRLAQLFAQDLAAGDLVFLGPGDDEHVAQQSIRTFFNVTRPERGYVKTALSIRNMGFSRGISASLPARGAAVNEWVAALVRADTEFARFGFRLLRETAFVGYRHRAFERASRKRVDDYKDMLGALWRESPLPLLRPGQRLMTMAALLHRDADGRTLLPSLIEASGLSIEGWLRRYLRAYLAPQLHAFYRHGLVFTPHCENVMLVLEGHAPTGVVLKDLAEDIGVLNPTEPLPAPVRHLALSVPEEVMTLSIFTDAFDGVFRFVAALLHEHAGFSEDGFWRLVAECVNDYERDHPELAARFARLDLFAPTFIRNCLNRLQLRDPALMIDLNADEPVDSLQFAGTLANPIAPFARPDRREGETHVAT
jgi:siderophore synthetase component